MLRFGNCYWWAVFVCVTAEWDIARQAVHEATRDSSVECDCDEADADSGVSVETLRPSAAWATAEPGHCATDLRNVSFATLRRFCHCLCCHHTVPSVLVPSVLCAFSSLMLLVGRQEGHPACKTLEWWGGGVVVCLEQGADLHVAQLMPLPLTVSCFSKIQVGFTFLVPAHPGSRGKRAVKRVCVCVCVFVYP